MSLLHLAGNTLFLLSASIIFISANIPQDELSLRSFHSPHLFLFHFSYCLPVQLKTGYSIQLLKISLHTFLPASSRPPPGKRPSKHSPCFSEIPFYFKNYLSIGPVHNKKARSFVATGLPFVKHICVVTYGYNPVVDGYYHYQCLWVQYFLPLVHTNNT